MDEEKELSFEELMALLKDEDEEETEVDTDNLIVVTQKEYDDLCERVAWLGCLEEAGVDNWEGYEEARRIWYELYEEGNDD